jgi:membrane protein DedA with SNARE-associated domain
MDEFALTELVTRYGYLGTFVGTLLEGETFLLLAGIAARQEYLEFWTLVLVATCGALVTDNAFFALGRFCAPWLFSRLPRLGGRSRRVGEWVARYPYSGVIAMRFLYGTRSVGPVLVGTGPLPWLHFALLDLVAASSWSALWIGLGWLVGEALSRWLAEAAPLVLTALAVVATLVIIALVIRHAARRSSVD